VAKLLGLSSAVVDDVYSLGVILYQMLMGELPFTGDSAMDVFAKMAMDDVPILREHWPDADEQLEAVLSKAMAKQVKDRYPTMHEFADALAGRPHSVPHTLPAYPPSMGNLSLSVPVEFNKTPIPLILPMESDQESEKPRSTTLEPRPSRGKYVGLSLLAMFVIGVVVWGLLLPKPAPPDNGEKVEEFAWKGVNRTRTVKTIVIGGEKVEFVKVPAGSFTMGLPESDKDAQADEKPEHTVTFTQPRWVAKYPVTKAQFAAFVKSMPYKSEAEEDGEGGNGWDEATGNFEGRKPKYTWQFTGWTQTDQHTVVNVTYQDAMAYCAWATKQANIPVRLLSEAEYEYANRAGSKTRYFTGDDVESLEGYVNIADKSLKAKVPGFTFADFDDGEPFTSQVGKYRVQYMVCVRRPERVGSPRPSPEFACSGSTQTRTPPDDAKTPPEVHRRSMHPLAIATSPPHPPPSKTSHSPSLDS
jgi:hypothetical protein